jgi:hypothetical protein
MIVEAVIEPMKKDPKTYGNVAINKKSLNILKVCSWEKCKKRLVDSSR